MKIPGKPNSRGNEICNLGSKEESQKDKKLQHIETKKYFSSEAPSSSVDVKLKSRMIKDKAINPEGNEFIINKEELIKRKVTVLNDEKEALELKVANFIFSAMNNEDNPLYTYPGGGKSPSAKAAASSYKEIYKDNFFNEIDLFFQLHTIRGQLDLVGLANEYEIESVFKKYGVILINGLSPDKNSTLVIGCGHKNNHNNHSGRDTVDITGAIKPDALLQWGDKRATEYLGTLSKYTEIIDEGPLCSFMDYSDEYFASVRSCLIADGKLRLPSHTLKDKIPIDFVKDETQSNRSFGTRHMCTTFTFNPN